MTSYNFGDVVLVPFPFTDQTTNKKRPAVVISSDVYNAEYLDRILMGITSQVSIAILNDSYKFVGVVPPCLPHIYRGNHGAKSPYNNYANDLGLL